MSNTTYKTTASLKKALVKIADSAVKASKSKTKNGTLLYLSGSDLTPINLGKLTY